jgi:hypothetical protein
MSFTDIYFQKHRFLMPQIKAPPSRGLRYIVVIPAYLEKRIFDTLISLKNTNSIDDKIEVLVVVNYSETDSQEIKTTNQSDYEEILKWGHLNSRASLRFFALLAPDLPAKHAGAGLARKIGMDEAVYRFGLVNNSKGIILSLDADTQVDSQYFSAIVNEFTSTPDAGGCILRFAHPIDGTDYSDRVYKAILLYELHLRYYKYALELSGFPYPYYTIGSCFGVRADFYAQQGGMNRRKAGEDFFFLNKLFPHRTFCEIKGTCVYPSPRPSSRVPFGTGPVVQQLVDLERMQYLTYDLQAFIDLQSLFRSISEFYTISDNKLNDHLTRMPDSVSTFLKQNNFTDKLKELRKNTASEIAFIKRFYLWFDGFKIVKFLNFSHNVYYRKTDICEAAKQLLTSLKVHASEDDPRSLLLLFRDIDHKINKI